MENDAFFTSLGITGITNIVVVLVCIACSWWGLQQLRLDVFLKNPKSTPAKILLIFLSVALGYQVASFLIAYFEWTGMMKGHKHTREAIKAAVCRVDSSIAFIKAFIKGRLPGKRTCNRITSAQFVNNGSKKYCVIHVRPTASK